MMQSMYSGVAGLNTQQTEMDVIGDNIANVSTVGFKSSDAIFEEALAQTMQGASTPTKNLGGSNPVQIGLGVQIGSIQVSQSQGSLTNTGKNTDLAVDGAGFFVMGGPGGEKYFTRDGAFGLDGQCHLVSPSNGYFVEGWQADVDGNIKSDQPVSPIQVPLGSSIVARASDAGAMEGNLDSGTAVGGQVTSAINLYDSLGNCRSVTLTFTNEGNNSWSWAASGSGVKAGSKNQGTITYNPDGVVVSSTGTVELDNSATGAQSPQDIALDFTKTTQYAASSTMSPANQNGYPAGTLDSFTISATGVVTGTFTNGINKAVGQIALANFSNPSALQRMGNSLFQPSNNSGLANVGTAQSGGRGAINTGTLEASNVRLADQFTDMIQTERAYEANSKIISVADEMLQDLVNLKRA
jgi:flagellar hook protein FlgE